MTERTTRRLTAIAGIASLVFLVIAFIVIGNIPGDNAPAQDVSKFVADHRTRLLTSVYLFGISMALILCFLTGLWVVLRPAERGSGVLSTLGLLGGVAWVVVLLSSLVFAYALGYRKNPDPGTARMLLDGVNLAGNVSGFPIAVSLVGFSGAIFLGDPLPRWLGWAGLVIAAWHLIAAASLAGSGLFTPSVAAGAIAPLVYYLWVLAACVLIWIARPGNARSSA